jgi:hypothetical protein
MRDVRKIQSEDLKSIIFSALAKRSRTTLVECVRALIGLYSHPTGKL